MVKKPKEEKTDDSGVLEKQGLGDALVAASIAVQKQGGELRATADAKEFNKKLLYTGLLEVDLNLRIGLQSKSMLLGEPSAGKSLFMYMMIAAIQRTCRACQTPIIPFINDRTGESRTTCRCGKNDGMVAVLIDAEGDFDPLWAQAWGVQLGTGGEDVASYREIVPGVRVSPNAKFVIVRLDNIDQMAPVVRQLVSKGAVDFVGIDGVISLETKEYSEGKNQPGSKARAISQLVSAINSGSGSCWIRYKTAPTIIISNQYRNRIGGISPMADPRQAGGGYSLAHLAFQTLHIRTAYSDDTGGFKGVNAEGEVTIKSKKDKFSGSTGAESKHRIYLQKMSVKRVEYNTGDTDEGAKLWNIISEIGSTGDRRWFYKDTKGYHVLGRTFTTAKDIQIFLARPDIGFQLRLPIFCLKLNPVLRNHLDIEHYNYNPFKDEPILELINEAKNVLGKPIRPDELRTDARGEESSIENILGGLDTFLDDATRDADTAGDPEPQPVLDE